MKVKVDNVGKKQSSGKLSIRKNKVNVNPSIHSQNEEPHTHNEEA